MSKYKLLLLDLDGTTVASKGDALPSERVVNAIKQAQQHLHVAIATGRPKDLAQSIIDLVGIYGPSVFNGGAEIIDAASGELLHEQLLSVESMRELVVLAATFNLEVHPDKDEYGAPISNPNQIVSPTAKIFIGSVPTVDASHLIEMFSSVEGAVAHIASSWGDGDVVDIHITHEHATKRYGVEKLMSILNVKREEVIAIGDGYNDLPMMEAAGFKVAMGNAPDEIKLIADYVAPSLDDDGVADTIERFILSDN